MVYVQASNGLYYFKPIWYGKNCKALVRLIGIDTVLAEVVSSGSDDYSRRKCYDEMEKLDGCLKIGELLGSGDICLPPDFFDFAEGLAFESAFKYAPPKPDYYDHEVDHVDLLSDWCMVWEHNFPIKSVLSYIRGEIDFPLLEVFYHGMSRMRIKNRVLKQVTLERLKSDTGYVRLHKCC